MRSAIAIALLVALTVAARPQCHYSRPGTACLTTTITVRPGECVEIEPCRGDDWDAVLTAELIGAPDGVSLRFERRDTGTRLFVCTAQGAPYALHTPVALTYTSAGGTTRGGSMQISTGDPLTMTAISEPTEITYGDTVWVEMLPSGGDPPYTYRWTASVNLGDANARRTFSRPVKSSRYFANVTDAAGNTAHTSTDVNVHPVMHAYADPETVRAGESSSLWLEWKGGNHEQFVLWTPGDDLDDPLAWRPTATPSQTTEYTALMIMIDNVATFASVTVTVLDASGP